MKKDLIMMSLAIQGAMLLGMPQNASAEKSQPVLSVAQAQKIQGQVVDENGEPMIGVTVRAKGAQAATVTDLDGKFSLNIPAGVKNIEVSYLGYNKQTISIVGIFSK